MFSAKHRTVILSKTGNCFCRPSTSCRTRLPCWWQFWCRGTATVRCVNRRWWRVPASARQQPPQHGLRRSSVRRTRRRHHAELPSWQSFLSSTTFHGSSSTTDPKTRLRFHVLNDQVQVLGMQVQVWVPSTNMRKTAAAGVIHTYVRVVLRVIVWNTCFSSGIQRQLNSDLNAVLNSWQLLSRFEMQEDDLADKFEVVLRVFVCNWDHNNTLQG